MGGTNDETMCQQQRREYRRLIRRDRELLSIGKRAWLRAMRELYPADCRRLDQQWQNEQTIAARRRGQELRSKAYAAP